LSEEEKSEMIEDLMLQLNEQAEISTFKQFCEMQKINVIGYVQRIQHTTSESYRFGLYSISRFIEDNGGA
jgi:hypothetical protein